MTIFDGLDTLVKQTQSLVIVSLFAAMPLLSACQSNESFSADRTTNSAINSSSADKSSNNKASANNCQNTTITKAFNAQQSDRQVQGCGTIIKVLADDNEGSRHQKILVKLDGVSPKHTVLLVHNIDLAPRVADVARGTVLGFYGEYVYNDKGGLVHWTHHDPAARHQGGWIESNGVRYQ